MQSSLHFTTQTSLPAIAAKSFAMKKTLADQVRAYIAFQGDGYTPARLAADVAKLQWELPEGKRCKRQNIEQLLEGGFRTVRYLPALAAAMGTTVETLAAGTFAPGDAAALPAPPPPYLPGFESLSIPVLANAGSMGPGNDQLHDDVVIGRLTVSPEWALKTLKPTSLQNLRFIHGYGDSMRGTYDDGDILLVDVGVQDPKIDGVYVLEANQRIYIKRVRQRIDGSYEISSDNPNIKTVDVLNGDQQVSVHGRVVWAWNGKKL